MDERRFDEFVTAVSRTTSRRQLLRMLAAGTLASVIGRTRASGALAAQTSDAPLPNFTFMVALPTDPGYEDYGLSTDLTGPPTRFNDINALPSLPDDWKAMVSQCRGAYVATIAQPKSDAPDEPQRAITTILFDLGTPDNADATRRAYLERLLENPTRQTLDPGTLPSSGRDRITLIGCEGGCADFSSPSDPRISPSDEAAAVGSNGRFVFDARIREFSRDSIGPDQIGTLAVGIDSKLGVAGGVGSTGTSAQAAAKGMTPARRVAAAAAAIKRRLLLQGSDSTRQTLASSNTLPVFGVRGVDAPKTATQWLRVDDGDTVINFGQSAYSAAADQRNVNDVTFALTLKQPLPLDQPVFDGYNLALSATQYVFASADEAQEFLSETQDRVARARPQLTVTDTEDDQDERSSTYEEDIPLDSATGTAYGLLTHVVVPYGSLAALIQVDLAAVPKSGSEDPIDPADVRQDLGSFVDQIVQILSDCLNTPETCSAAAELNPQGTIVPRESPKPTSTPTPADCASGLQRCGDFCVDPSSDPANCGACGNACGNLSCCAGVCTDTTSDPANCSGCGLYCGDGVVCTDGSCDCGSDLWWCNGVCVNYLTDASNCGSCGYYCSPDQICGDGQCVCSDYSPPCGDTCCTSDMVCSDGTCVYPCESGLIPCGPDCVDPYSDPRHCGGCNIPCAATCCDGQCFDLDNDPYNCGQCYYVCSSGQECLYGSCYEPPK